MARIPEQIIADVRDRTDILQVVGEYVQLKRAGAAYKGLCPFHGEKTPSFHVNPQRGIYKCFGCSVGGNAFKFLMEIEGWSFPEAVRHLAGRAGIEIPETNAEDDEKARLYKRKKDRYHRIYASARSFYEYNLWSGKFPEAQEYLASRGIDEETARAFGLGYAPDAWSSLLDALEQQGVRAMDLEIAGLAAPGKRGHYDRFRARLMFPVVDIWGHTVAFSGRILKEDPERPGAKYINSPETDFYTKGKVLFGLGTTKADIKREDAALLVEGNFDVVSLYARGFRHAVAPLGTALTEQQVRLLSRYTKHAFVAFDGDNAGVAATRKSMPMLMNHDVDARVLRFEPGDDPDAVVRRDGPEALKQLLAGSTPIASYVLDLIVGPLEGAPIEEIAANTPDLAEFFASIPTEMVRNHYLGEASRRLQLSPQELKRHLSGRMPRMQPPPPEATHTPPQSDLQARRPVPMSTLEAACFQIVAESDERVLNFVEDGCCDLLGDERLVYLLERAAEQVQSNGKADVADIALRLSEEIHDPDFYDQITRLLCAERAYTEASAEATYELIVTKLQRAWVENETQQVLQLLQTAAPGSALEADALEKLNELNKTKSDLDIIWRRKRDNNPSVSN